MADDRPQIGANWLEDLIYLNKSITETVLPFKGVLRAELATWQVEYAILTDDDIQDIFEKLENFTSILSRDRELRKLTLALALKGINGIPVCGAEDFERWKGKDETREKATVYEYKRELIGSWEPMVVDYFYNGYTQVIQKREEGLRAVIKKSPPPLSSESAGRSEGESDSTKSSESADTDLTVTK